MHIFHPLKPIIYGALWQLSNRVWCTLRIAYCCLCACVYDSNKTYYAATESFLYIDNSIQFTVVSTNFYDDNQQQHNYLYECAKNGNVSSGYATLYV